jgi:hypothetical protein
VSEFGLVFILPISLNLPSFWFADDVSHVSRFIYGGLDEESQEKALNDIYVLTLPGFQWFRANVTGTPREEHACAVVGNRQMIVVGGVDTSNNTFWPTTDPWQNGLGVLDLPTLAWSDHFDSNASKYDSPEAVKNWYSNGYVDQESFSWLSFATDTQ